jgi:hypothetical protein
MIATASLSTGATAPTAQPSFADLLQGEVSFELICKTVIRSAAGVNLSLLTQSAPVPNAAIAAFEQLILLLRRLNLTIAESAAPSVPADWLPYVSDEVYDTLEALHSPACPTASVASPASPIVLDVLIPQLLWAIARISYPIMQLLEGIEVCAAAPGQPWIAGSLRLVTLLEIDAPVLQSQFDLATHRQPLALLDRTWQIESELDLSLTEANLERGNRNAQPQEQERSLDWASQQLSQISQMIAAANPVLGKLLGGSAIDLLIPKNIWHQGELRLKLDFEFLPHRFECPPSDQFNWVDAELVDEDLSGLPLAPGCSGHGNRWADPSVAVLEIPEQTSMPTAIVQVVEESVQQQYQQFAWQHQRQTQLEAMWQKNCLSSNGAETRSGEHQAELEQAELEQARSLIRLGQQGATQTLPSGKGDFLLQPELLLDELTPKLLWHLTRHSYPIMQLVGGVTGQWMQPGAPWRRGIIRLSATLELNLNGRREAIDLVTGRCMTTATVCEGAIAQLESPLWHQLLFSTESLLHQVNAHLRTLAPDLALLMDGIAIACLTPNQDWQPGTLQLVLTIACAHD